MAPIKPLSRAQRSSKSPLPPTSFIKRFTRFCIASAGIWKYLGTLAGLERRWLRQAHLLIIYGIRRGRGRRGALFLLLLGCLVRGPVGDDLDADREEDDEHVDAHQRE